MFRRKLIFSTVIMLTRIMSRRGFILIGKMVSLAYYVFNVKSKSIVKSNLRSNHIKFSIKLYLNFAQFLCENIYLLSNELDEKIFALHNTDALEGALRKGRGVMMICFHYGAWDIAGQYMSKKGYPMNVIYEMKDDWIYEYIDSVRVKYDMKLIDRNSPVSEFIKILKSGEILTVFIDQKSENLALKEVPFLNSHRRVPSGWYRLLKASNAIPVISYTKLIDSVHHIFFKDASAFSFEDYYRFVDRKIREDIYQYDFYDQIWSDINI